MDLQGDRDRAEEGRGAQLRHPQAGRRIRRRDERPAQGHLRAARRHHGRRKRRATSSPTCAPRPSLSIVAVHCPPKAPIPSNGTSQGLKESIEAVFGLQPPLDEWLEEEAVEPEMHRRAASERSPTKRWRPSSTSVDPERWNDVEKQILIQTLDHHWKEHLATLDALRQVIHLRSYAQKKPIDEYKQEAFLLFERLLVSIREEVTRILMRAQVQLEDAPPPVLPDFITQHLDPFSGDDDTADIDAATGAILSNLPPLNIPQPPLPQREPTATWSRRRSAATRHARAARARSTSIATGSSRSGRARRSAPIDRTALRRAYRPDEETVVAERLGAGAARSRDAGRSDGDRARAGQGRARAQAVGHRRLPPRLRPRQRRGHRHDVPGRGAAAHPRRAHRRRADRRQAGGARLVREARRVGLARSSTPRPSRCC